MHSIDLIYKVRQLYSRHKNYRKVATILKMRHNTIMYMVKNDYGRLKKKRGPKNKITSRDRTKIKREVRRLQSSNQKVSQKNSK